MRYFLFLQIVIFTVFLKAAPDTATYTIGGVLGLVRYRFYSMSFYWNLALGRAGTTVDGERYTFGKKLDTLPESTRYIDSFFLSSQYTYINLLANLVK